MVVLNGRNLGERQRDLNRLVAEVVANKKGFEEIKHEEESTDIDTLYKIDIASHYKDIPYIMEVLKSGDSLYIARALKCFWLYDDSHSDIMNAEYLHNNLFPFMSIKMKKKMLTTISMHVRNVDRAASFFTYCRKNDMPVISLKFLNFTSEDFKLDILGKDHMRLPFDIVTQNQVINFIGNSFELATISLDLYSTSWRLRNLLYKLSFLYSINNEKYLNLIEKYEKFDLNSHNSSRRLGLTISKDILKKHKDRVLNNTLLYVNILNKRMLSTYSTIDDAKNYLTDLMPPFPRDFWRIDICETYNYILDLIPLNEKFKFVKQLFNSKYPGEAFEMTKDFYRLNYYEMLSIDERERWALQHISEKKELLGSENDYIWYKFVNFDAALIEIIKYIAITPYKDKRSNILNILVESARDQNDLIKLLKYYYERHVNESAYYKQNFINEILQCHNVFEFNIECWEELDKLFYSLDIYTVGNYNSIKKFMAISVCFHILHKKEMPQALNDFVDLDVNYSHFSLLLPKLGEDKAEIIFKYLLQLFVEKLLPYETDASNKQLRSELRQYVNNIFTLLGCFQKDEKELPEIVTKFIDSPKDESCKKTMTGEDIFRLLKSDAAQAVDVLSHFDKDRNNCPTRLVKVFKKLKVYFNDSVAQEYLKFFDTWLLKLPNNYGSYNLIKTSVFGLLQLGDESFKVNLMEKYEPTQPKIDHRATDKKSLYVQEAICRLVGYSRPPVPIENVLKFIKGDYVQYCLPTFNMYLANLPQPQVTKFIELILNTPVSVQKHGLRLAFKCFSIDDLKRLMVHVWKKSKNVSLRMIIYKSLFEKIIEVDEHEQAELYEILKYFTQDLHQDDVFDLIVTGNISNKHIGDYLRTCWDMVVKLPEKSINVTRQTQIVNYIKQNYHFVGSNFARERIISEHVHDILENRKFSDPSHLTYEMKNLWDSKWILTATYIVNYNGEELTQRLDLLTYIFEKCLDMWNEGKFISRTFYFDFIETLKQNSIDARYHKPLVIYTPIFQHILTMLQNKLPLREIYATVWDLQLLIFVESVFCDREKDAENLSLKEVLVSFANQIGAFVKLLRSKQQFYMSFLNQIVVLLNIHMNRAASICTQKNNCIYIFSESMLDLDMKDTHLLVVLLLPQRATDEMKDDHIRIIKKIQNFEDEEVQSCLFSKFSYMLISSVKRD